MHCSRHNQPLGLPWDPSSEGDDGVPLICLLSVAPDQTSMVSFLSLWQGTAKSLGFKRSQTASGQEESPAKKAKAQAQQQGAAGPMPDTQTGHERDAPVGPHSRGDGAVDGTHLDSRPAQQSYDPQRYQPQQQLQQPQGASSQQEPVAANPSSSSFTHAAYEKARQTLVQMPACTAAAARRGQHAGAAPHRLHMPLPRQPAQQQLQVCALWCYWAHGSK